jgi:L(+)-tartrate dehydratase beta subunit
LTVPEGATELTTPLSEDVVRQLRVGDQVSLTGTVWGLRDATLIHWEANGHAFPADLGEAALLHTQPNARQEQGRWLPTCIGTTTSQRMDRFTLPLLERYRVRAIIGKGGLSQASAAAMAEHGCVYLAAIGGAASVTTLQVEAIEEVYWEHLLPECLWKLRVRSLGPLFVGIDCTGRNLHDEVTAAARSRLARMLSG